MGAWLLPTSHEDSPAWWNESSAYDNNPSYPNTDGTYAYGYAPNADWTDWLVLTYSDGVTGDRIRFLAGGSASGYDYAQVEIFYSSDWHQVYSGTFAYNTWKEVTFDSQTYTRVRIRLFNNTGSGTNTGRVYELHLYDLTATSTSTSTTTTTSTSTSTTTATTTSTSTSSSSSTSSSTSTTTTSTSTTTTSTSTTTGTTTSTSTSTTTSTSTSTTLAPARLGPVPRVVLDGHSYYIERRSFEFEDPREVDEQLTATHFQREDGGLAPRSFRMNIICQSRSELYELSGSFLKTSIPNPLTFTDTLGLTWRVYFERMGPIERIDRVGNIFRVPIELTEAS